MDQVLKAFDFHLVMSKTKYSTALKPIQSCLFKFKLLLTFLLVQYYSKSNFKINLLHKSLLGQEYM